MAFMASLIAMLCLCSVVTESTETCASTSDDSSLLQSKATISEEMLMPMKYSQASVQALQQSHNISVTSKKPLLRPCASSRITNPEDKQNYKSQDGEDMRIETGYFSGLCGGTYLEMGALDGIKFSNTFMFNRNLNWKGLLVEADPENFANLAQNRQDEIALEHMAACSKSMPVHWVAGDCEACRGIFEFMDEDLLQKVHPVLVGVPQSELSKQPNITKIECDTLTSMIDRHDVKHIDLFTLDVEGAEVNVLRSLDLDRISFGLLVIESNGHTEDLKAILESHGYKHVETYLRSDWFVNAHFKDWYGHHPEAATEESIVDGPL